MNWREDESGETARFPSQDEKKEAAFGWDEGDVRQAERWGDPNLSLGVLCMRKKTVRCCV